MVRLLSRRTFIVGCAGGLLAACSFGHVGSVPYAITVSGEGNALTLQEEQDTPGAYVATLQSARGIGQAMITWWGHASPHHVTFSLALEGLEHFSLHWAGHTVELSINARNQTVFASLRDAAGNETAITPESSYWMDVAETPADARGFTLHAPQAFLYASPPAWGISWIDFYR